MSVDSRPETFTVELMNCSWTSVMETTDAPLRAETWQICPMSDSPDFQPYQVSHHRKFWCRANCPAIRREYPPTSSRPGNHK